MRWIVVSLASCLFSATASAQSHRDVIVGQLDAAITLAADEGYSPDRRALPTDMLFGLLPPEGVVWLQVDLRAGTNYVIAGACDYDCSDMDLAVQHDTTVLVEDVEADDVPVLMFRSQHAGPHLVRVSMPGCEASGCYFGVRILSD